MCHHIVECADIHEYLREVEKLGRRGWIFRGHEDESWRLEPTLRRFLDKHDEEIEKTSWYVREREIVDRFKTVAHAYIPHVPMDDSDLFWLTLIQHYGGPTRLLDFTFNPAVAMYFAVRQDQPPTEPFCVHAVHVDAMRQLSCRLRGPTAKRHPKNKEYYIGRAAQPTDFVGIYEGPMANDRQAAQEGLFLVPSKIDMDIEEWLREAAKEPREKQIKPYDSPWITYRCHETANYYKIVKQLVQLGMSATRLFPGLEGLSKSLQFAWFEVRKGIE